MTPVCITVGAGLRNPQGRRVTLAGGLTVARALAAALARMPAAREAWWSPNTWTGDYRKSDHWESALGLAFDFDYCDENAEHAPIPAEIRRRLGDALRAGEIRANVIHATPRGGRALLLFPKPVTDRETFARAAAGACAAASEALAKLGLAATVGEDGKPRSGLHVDGDVTVDFGRLLFRPNAITRWKRADGTWTPWAKRTGRVIVGREEPYSPEDLAALAPPPPALEPPLEPSPEPEPVMESGDFAEAAARWNAAHPATWPTTAGPCFACSSPDGFKALPDSPGRWACFSSRHRDEAPGVGILGPSGTCYTGDSLDTEAHRRRCGRADVLRADGFLGDGRGRSPAAAPAAAEPARLVVVPVSEVESETVLWLWGGRLPRKKLVVLDGDPGLGKSTLALDIAARLSRGAATPDGSPGAGPECVIVASAEDGPGDTIRPRLEAAGADLSRIHLLLEVQAPGAAPRPLSLPEDLGLLRAEVLRLRPALVVVDPLVAYLSAGTNTWKDQDTRRVLHTLAKLAEESGAAILALRHLNKGESRNPLYRGGGSIGIIAAARVGLLVAPDPEDPDGPRRVLAVNKCNLAQKSPSLAYRIIEDPAHKTARIEWLGQVATTARALLAEPAAGEDRDARAEAREFLREVLAGGPLKAEAVLQRARKAGVAERTLRSVKAAEGIRSLRLGDSWTWALPAEAAPPLDGAALQPLSRPGPVQGCKHSPCCSLAAFGKRAEIGW